MSVNKQGILLLARCFWQDSCAKIMRGLRTGIAKIAKIAGFGNDMNFQICAQTLENLI